MRCRLCSKARDPREFVVDPIVGFCFVCLEWHRKALDVLAGAIPCGCQECGTGFGELKRRAPGGDLRMYLHPKDGIYQVLCETCSDNYELKRADLYGDTPYGQAKKLKTKT